MSLSESAAKELLSLLVERGYLHDGVVDPVQADPSRRGEQPSAYLDTDGACRIVSTRDGMYMSRTHFQDRLQQELSRNGGRCSIEKLATLLGVDVQHVEHAASKDITIRVDNDFILPDYMDHMALSTLSFLQDHNDGCAFVSELAKSVWNMPVNIVTSALEERVGSLVEARLVTLSGTKVMVTPAFEKRERCRIRGAFRAIALPTQVDSVCHDYDWDVAYVLPVLQEMCQSGEILGEVHGDVSGETATGAMYIPNIYLMMQRKTVDAFFAANGILTKKDCRAMGLLESKMATYVQETNPSAIPLPNSVIMRDVVVGPVEQALIETIANDAFLDLSLHLPQSILPYEQDVQMIVDYMALPLAVEHAGDDQGDGGGGITILSDGEALFVSQGMIRHISKTIVPPLLEDFGKTRAEQLLSAEPVKDDSTTEEPGKKSPKRKGRKRAKSTSSATLPTTESSGVVPLATVAKSVATEYPDLADIQASFGPLFDVGDENAPTWEPDSMDASDSGGPLYQVCRSVVYNEEFQTSCDQAVRAERERLESIRMSTSVASRRDGAARVRSIESAFENPACFRAACFTMQAHAKFLQYASASPDLDEADLALLKEDFLCGCCADFTSRITQYCLFRNEIEDGLFVIESHMAEEPDEVVVESDLPAYCKPIDIGARRFPSTRLLSAHGGLKDESSMPLPTLREVLPGNVGVMLARMWTLCGGKCYEGGSRVGDDGTETFRPGDPDGFLSHVEETCLTICGLPLKKLDKKAEKQFLFARRKALTEALEATTDAKVVLEVTVMLLFQQVKNLVVSGAHLSGAVLMLLQKEKKISEEVSKLLQGLADTIESQPDEAAIAAVKACGLSRDISKHVVESTS